MHKWRSKGRYLLYICSEPSRSQKTSVSLTIAIGGTGKNSEKEEQLKKSEHWLLRARRFFGVREITTELCKTEKWETHIYGNYAAAIGVIFTQEKSSVFATSNLVVMTVL